jgi:hypothetical protein
MDILINKRYEVFLDGQLSYVISSKIFSLLPNLTISDSSTKEVKLKLKGVLAFFTTAFDIHRDNEVFNLRLKKAWKTQYNCQVGRDLYEIYAHRGRKYSVFKNDIQIAWWDSDLVIVFGSRYKIIADKDSDYELLIAFCIGLEGGGGGSSMDVGNIGGQGKIFDPHWQPKY